jgi:hypothetical protein
MSDTDALPVLSVVLALDSQRQRCESALRSLLAQSIVSRMEILLLDFGHREHPPLPGSHHPSVRSVPMERAAAGYGETLARGVTEAAAPVVAFVEEHVNVLPGWAEAIVAAHEGPWAAVCGELHPGDLGRAVARRIELVSRHHWSPPAQRGAFPILRWQNVAYKRDRLLRYQPHLHLLLESEATLFAQLRRDRQALFVEPAARMVHAHEVEWAGFLRGSFYSHRVSAAAAAEYLKLGVATRLARIAAAAVGPLRWPLVLFARSRRLPHRDVWLPILYANAGYVLQYYSTVALATLIGLLAGRGRSSRQFLDFELNQPRRQPDDDQGTGHADR